ncbi:MAG: polysaccharide biosynthesis protein [Clostridia bacterium]
MNEQSSTAKNFMLLSIAGIVAKLFSALYVPFLQAIVGADGIGMYSRSYDVFMFAYAVTTMGCQPAVTKIVAELRANNNERDTVKVLDISKKIFGTIGAIGTIIILLGAYPYTKYYEIQSSFQSILFLAPSIFLTTILAAYRGFFQGKGNMKSIAISQVLEQLLNVVVSLICALLFVRISVPMGSAGGTIGTSIGAIISILYLVIIYRRNKYDKEYIEHMGDKSVKSSSIRRKLFRYSFPIVLSAAIQNFGGVIDMMNVNLRLLHAGFSPKMSDVLYGYLYYYKVLTGVPLIIITAICTIILTAISKAYALRDKKTIITNVNFAFRLTLAITIPASIGLAVLSKNVYQILFRGNGYTLMIYGSIILVFMGMAQIQGVILQGISKFTPMIIAFTIGIVIKIIANYILVGIYSINIYGALIGNLLMYAIPTYLNNRTINKSLKYKTLKLNEVLKPVLGSIAMGIGLIILKTPMECIRSYFDISGAVGWMYTLIYTIVLVFIGVMIYVYVMMIIGGIKKEDIESLPHGIYNRLPKYLKNEKNFKSIKR